MNSSSSASSATQANVTGIVMRNPVTIGASDVSDGSDDGFAVLRGRPRANTALDDNDE
jgi:hypothetical protein